MHNIPSIEELDRIGLKAANLEAGSSLHGGNLSVYVKAIVNAVVAACRPQLRPIAEMPVEVPEGCVRKFTSGPDWLFSCEQFCEDTHFIDIALPSPLYPAEFEQAFEESGLQEKDKAAVFNLWNRKKA